MSKGVNSALSCQQVFLSHKRSSVGIAMLQVSTAMSHMYSCRWKWVMENFHHPQYQFISLDQRMCLCIFLTSPDQLGSMSMCDWGQLSDTNGTGQNILRIVSETSIGKVSVMRWARAARGWGCSWVNWWCDIQPCQVAGAEQFRWWRVCTVGWWDIRRSASSWGRRVGNDWQIRMILQELMRLGMLPEFSQVSKLSNL